VVIFPFCHPFSGFMLPFFAGLGAVLLSVFIWDVGSFGDGSFNCLTTTRQPGVSPGSCFSWLPFYGLSVVIVPKGPPFHTLWAGMSNPLMLQLASFTGLGPTQPDWTACMFSLDPSAAYPARPASHAAIIIVCCPVKSGPRQLE